MLPVERGPTLFDEPNLVIYPLKTLRREKVQSAVVARRIGFDRVQVVTESLPAKKGHLTSRLCSRSLMEI